MTTSYLKFCSVTFVLMLLPLAAKGQDPTVQQLEKQLRERDKVILELLERVEALEKRVGVERPLAESKENEERSNRQAKRESQKTVSNSKEKEPGTVVVNEEDAERALERSLTRAGALLLSPGVLEIEPGFTYSRTEDSSPFLLSSDNQLLAAETEFNANSYTASLGLRLGLPWDSQLEIGIPYRWRDVESVDVVGFVPASSSSRTGDAWGDLRVGLAKTLLREGLWRPDLIGRITWDTDTGKTSDNDVPLGGGFNELRGSLTAIKRQDPLAIVGSLSYEYSFENDDIKPGPVYSASLGSFIALSPETSMSFLFYGAYQDESEFLGESITGSDRTFATFAIGGSTLLAPGTLLNLSVEIGLTDDADDFAVSVSLPIRFGNRLY